jgi:hypothetical protein
MHVPFYLTTHRYVADTAMLPEESTLTNLDRPKRRLLDLIMV